MNTENENISAPAEYLKPEKQEHVYDFRYRAKKSWQKIVLIILLFSVFIIPLGVAVFNYIAK